MAELDELKEGKIIPKGELRTVPIKDIKVSARFRKEYGDLDELCESIKEHGIIQPISLNRDLELAAGGRRYAAAVMAGLTEIPALIRDTVDQIDKLEIELFENIHRKDMEWAEEVALTKAINDLYISKYGKEWSGRKTAQLLGKSTGGVADNIKLAKAIEEVPELAKCKNKHEATKLLKKVEKAQVVEELAKKQEERIKKEKANGIDQLARADANFRIGDCFDGLEDTISVFREMGRASNISLIEVDPPYAIDLQELKQQKGVTDANLEKYKEISRENYPNFLNRLTSLLYKVAAPDSWVVFWFGPTWFCEVKSALINAGFKVDDIPGIWIKGSEDSEGHGQTNQPKYYLGRAYEPFFIARKGSPEIQKQGRPNTFLFRPVPPNLKYHPTQRPIDLISEILTTFTTPGSTVLVPFLGSGATLRAAYRCKMNAFGWELNEHNKQHFMLAVEADMKAEEMRNEE